MAAGALILRHNASDSKHTILGLWLTLRRFLVWTQILLFAVVLQISPHAFPYVHHVQWQTRNYFSLHRACNGRGQPCPRIVKLHACLCYFVLRLFVGCAVTHGCKPWSYRRGTHRQVSVPAPAVGMPTASPPFYLFPYGSIGSFFPPRTCSFAVAYGARGRPFYFKISHLPLVSILPSPLDHDDDNNNNNNQGPFVYSCGTYRCALVPVQHLCSPSSKCTAPSARNLLFPS
jgi:hypothetical protein